jgi:hypothetical protein
LGGVALFAVAALCALLLWAHDSPSAKALLQRSTTPRLATQSFVLGQPVLVLVDSTEQNVFAAYITEILRAEGLVAFDVRDVASIRGTSQAFSSYALVITATGSTRLGLIQDVLERHVNGGGRMIMIAPPPDFDSLLGVSHVSITHNGEIRTNPAHDLAEGLTPARMRFFGPATLFSPVTASVVAYVSPLGDSGRDYVGFGINASGKGRAGARCFPGSRA